MTNLCIYTFNFIIFIVYIWYIYEYKPSQLQQDQLKKLIQRNNKKYIVDKIKDLEIYFQLKNLHYYFELWSNGDEEVVTIQFHFMEESCCINIDTKNNFIEKIKSIFERVELDLFTLEKYKKRKAKISNQQNESGW